MAKKTGGEAVVDSLIANDVEVVFGLPGAQLDPLFAAFHDRQDKIRIIHSRHEQGCAYMAYGYAEASGKLGACLVVPGPGMLNAGAAIATAYACNTPVLWLVGQGRTPLIGKGFGVLHEIPDQFETARTLVKSADRVTHPSNATRKIADSINKIWEGRPRPVYLELPFDLSNLETEVPEEIRVSQEPDYPVVDQDRIDQAAKWVAGADCAVIMVGGGARDSRQEIQELAEKLNLPVIMSQNALGTLDCRHPLAFTQAAGSHWWAKADVVLAFGTRLFPAAMTWGRDKNLRIIKVDVDAEELTRLPGPIDGIHGDVATVARMISAAAEPYIGPIPDRTDEMQTVRAAVDTEVDMVGPQRELLHVIREEIGEDGVLVSDLTQLYFAAQDAFPVYNPRTYIHPSYQGTLGHAAATVLGAKVAVPDQPVVCVAGDGGFMFTINDLITAVQYKIGAIFIVMNDGAFGNVKRIMNKNYDGRVICADLENPDFIKLAEAFGMPGRKADSADTLRTALRESIREGGPALIEYEAGEFPDPWHLHFRPKVRGG
jgi:acetolactate synthase-1/2/3 large subunit